MVVRKYWSSSILAIKGDKEVRVFSQLIGTLTLQAPVSTYKFSKLISIHFLTELVERNCSRIKAFFLRLSFYLFS